MTELISIIVPIYNGERYLKECLDSLKTQDYPNVEILLIDDGSTDRTADICRQYTSDDQRFHYIHQQNGGQNAARKTGVEHASGEWVMFVDADDFVTIDYCSSFMRVQSRTAADMVIGELQKYQDGRYGAHTPVMTGVLTGKEVLESLLMPRFFGIRVSFGIFPILFRMKIIHNTLMKVDLRIRFAEDAGCTICSLLQAKKVAFLPQVKYFYRSTNSSCCHTHTKSVLVDQKLLRRFIRKSIQNSIVGIKNVKAVEKMMDNLIIDSLLLGGYEFFSDFAGLYPFREILPEKRIVIYGAGVFGEEIHDKFPGNLELVGWVDRQADYYQSLGKLVSPVERLPEMKFDYVVIAITDPYIVDQIVCDLQDINIPKEKILRIDEKWINSDYTEKKLQELEEVDENYHYVSTTISNDSVKC